MKLTMLQRRQLLQLVVTLIHGPAFPWPPDAAIAAATWRPILQYCAVTQRGRHLHRRLRRHNRI